MANHESLFRPENQERLKEYPYLITISGYSGVGKTKTGEAIAMRLGMRYFKGGELIRLRHRERTKKDIVGPTNRKVREDINLDRELAKLIKRSSYNHPSVIESRLGGLIAKGVIKIEDEDGQIIEIPQNPGIVTVCIIASDENTRFKRLEKRYSAESGSILPFEEIKHLTREREKQDLSLWMEAHPELRELNIQNPFDPELKTLDGKRVYDIVIDTQNLNLQEATEELMRRLKLEEKNTPERNRQSMKPKTSYFIG